MEKIIIKKTYGIHVDKVQTDALKKIKKKKARELNFHTIFF